MGTRRLPPRDKRGRKKEDSSNPSACPRNRRMFVFFSNRNSIDHIDEESSSSLKNKRNGAKKKIHEVKCKSPQGVCIIGEVEEECTSSFLVGDLQITAQYVGLFMAKDISFGSDPKDGYKSNLQSPREPHT